MVSGEPHALAAHLPGVDDLDRVGCADALAEAAISVRLVEARRLALVAHWADLHHPILADPHDPAPYRQTAGDGAPPVATATEDELGCLLGVSTVTASVLLRDVLNLVFRHPRLWRAVQDGRIEAWKARQAARACHVAGLSREQTHALDDTVTAALEGLPFGRAERVIRAEVIAADPQEYDRRRQANLRRRYAYSKESEADGLRMFLAHAETADVVRFDGMLRQIADLLPAPEAGQPAETLEERKARALGVLANPARACVLLAQGLGTGGEAEDSAVRESADLGRAILDRGPKALAALRPRTVLYLHHAPDGSVARAEGCGPLSPEELRSWVGHDHVRVTPVVDPHDQPALDRYEIPRRLREAVCLRDAYEVFPYGTLPARASDLDHTEPFDADGPPGQTNTGNLAPLSRRHHRAKTFGGFVLHQPLPGLFYWRTPTGHWLEVSGRGTTPLGREIPEILRELEGLPLAG